MCTHTLVLDLHAPPPRTCLNTTKLAPFYNGDFHSFWNPCDSQGLYGTWHAATFVSRVVGCVSSKSKLGVCFFSTTLCGTSVPPNVVRYMSSLRPVVRMYRPMPALQLSKSWRAFCLIRCSHVLNQDPHNDTWGWNKNNLPCSFKNPFITFPSALSHSSRQYRPDLAHKQTKIGLRGASPSHAPLSIDALRDDTRANGC
ncbi:unnamed protein product, partial [Ectocarpus fasciculatus]